jgi:hypothetical protein
MKAFRGWTISVGLVLVATAANAQGTAPQQAGSPHYQAASDFGEPYADGPPEAAPPGYGAPGYVAPAYGAPRYAAPEYAAPAYGAPGYGPALLPPQEVYAVLRGSGFSPLGVPRLRGLFYHIAAVDRRGDDGRLVIDARNGQIVRFVPAYRMGERFDEGTGPPYGYGPLAPMGHFGSPPRPPADVPRVASRMPQSVPMPKAAPSRPADDRLLTEKPAPAPKQQSASVQVKPAETPQTTASADAKPAAPALLPTQPMPKVQGLD